MSISTPVTAWYTPYISGMGLSYTSTTTITVDSGVATNGNSIATSNLITIVDPVVISTTTVGAGGLDTGTIAASTLYYVYAIGNSNSYAPGLNDQMDSTNPYPGSALISTSETPSLPFSYDMYRYIGSVYTNSSSQFMAFTQTGAQEGGKAGSARPMYYEIVIDTSVIGDTGATSYTAVSLAGGVPKPNLEVIIRSNLTPNAVADQLSLAPYNATGATAGYSLVQGIVAGVANVMINYLPCGSNDGVPTIIYKTTSADDVVSLRIAGYIDQI